MSESKKPPRARGRAHTLAAIIDAARKEFALKGYAGARMESIAQIAGINKELIYHYFRSKEHIFQEVRGHHRTDVLTDDARLDLPEYPPGAPGDLFAWRFDTATRHREWVKLLTWEAAQGEDKAVPCEETRREGLQRTINKLREAQKSGRINASFDPSLLQLAVFALATYPLAYGQITRMVTGRSASDASFQKEWREFLHQLGQLVLPPVPGESGTVKTSRAKATKAQSAKTEATKAKAMATEPKPARKAGPSESRVRKPAVTTR
ncbi:MULTISPECIES: TetR/AcrR family transcriptional regulator [unclassified Achromobacter]|uniref:TetR/AcrR family transcriptional regulator n=1 Tax=unclassified Achromobacter TaxID=2626865 RepID=UPI001303F259|nr:MULTISPECIES: TetR/AcrR family transcriptional regulator [unclassified Achromobacter]